MKKAENVVAVHTGNSIEINTGKYAFINHIYRQTMYRL